MTKGIAIYDMDRTITAAPTWTPFLAFAMRRRSRWRLAMLPAAVIALLAYGVRLIDRAKLKESTQRWLLGGEMAAERAHELAEAFAEHVVATGVLEQARARIAADKAEGYRLVLATASYAFYAREIGRRLGFDTVIATESQHGREGSLVARIAGHNCYGGEKLRRIEQWLAQEGIARRDARIRFYSDHVSDSPVLDWADEPFAVNAHGPLRTMARSRGWPLLDWTH